MYAGDAGFGEENRDGTRKRCSSVQRRCAQNKTKKSLTRKGSFYYLSLFSPGHFSSFRFVSFHVFLRDKMRNFMVTAVKGKRDVIINLVEFWILFGTYSCDTLLWIDMVCLLSKATVIKCGLN